MTLYLISERIFRIYSGGLPSVDSGIKIQDIQHMVIDQINALLKVETLNLNPQMGDNAPSGIVLATYNKVAVSTYNTIQSKAVLPAVPVSLPLNMGVWYVAPDLDDITTHDQFIPLQQGQWSLIKDFSPLVSTGKILDNYTYTLDGLNLVFPTDISSTITHVVIKLAVTDINELGDFDLLPIPTDYVDQVIKNVLAILGVVSQKEDDSNDSISQK